MHVSLVNQRLEYIRRVRTWEYLCCLYVHGTYVAQVPCGVHIVELSVHCNILCACDTHMTRTEAEGNSLGGKDFPSCTIGASKLGRNPTEKEKYV